MSFIPLVIHQMIHFGCCLLGNSACVKGGAYLLEAFRNFKHPNKELIVVGGVDAEIQRLIETMMGDNIIFVGAVSRDQVKKYMSSAQALVLPSIEEGLALVLAQAMACGCPVIATPNTGFETLFTHEKEGLIVEVRNSAALTAAFTRLADEPLLRNAMSKACVERAKALDG